MNFNQIQVGGPNDCPPATTTYNSSEEPIPKVYGWICPKCGRTYSPSTNMCLYCCDNKYNVVVSDKTFPNDYYIYNTLDQEWFINYNKPEYTSYNYNRKEEF